MKKVYRRSFIQFIGLILFLIEFAIVMSVVAHLIHTTSITLIQAVILAEVASFLSLAFTAVVLAVLSR